MTFTQSCDCYGAPLTGEIRYQSQLAPPMPAPQVLRVPQDYPTIQSAVVAASRLVQDTVLVSDGTYFENVDFLGKAVTVISVDGPQVTAIDGGGGAVVNFENEETTNSVLWGFTLTNGTTGANLYNSSPEICSNTIVNCGTGVSSEYGSPWVLNNYISGSAEIGVSFGGGGAPVLQGNTLVTNQAGGVGIGYNTPAIVTDNLIQGNGGDGITLYGGPSPVIAQNVIVDNNSNGISSDFWCGNMEGVIVNNTIVDNRVSGIALSGFDSGSLVANNIIFGMPALVIESCDGSLPSIEANDIYSPSGEAIAGGTITSLTQIPGNLSTDPWFACEPEGDFHLLAGSPCIDAGTNSAPDLAATDFDGNPRILAGNTNDAPAVDLGAYEFNPLNPPVPCMFINCQTDIVVYATAGENSAVVTFPTPTGTPVATIKCSPPSGSVFYGGTNVVNCTATYGTNSEICTFNVIVVVGPIITQQPKNLQVSAGESFTLSVGVAGTPPLAYQWSYETNLIAGRRARV